MHRLTILNIWVDPVTKEQALEKVKYYLEYGTRPHSIFASNSEKISLYQKTLCFMKHTKTPIFFCLME